MSPLGVVTMPVIVSWSICPVYFSSTVRKVVFISKGKLNEFPSTCTASIANVPLDPANEPENFPVVLSKIVKVGVDFPRGAFTSNNQAPLIGAAACREVINTKDRRMANRLDFK